MYHIFFIHSSVDGHLGCFHVMAIVNSVLSLCLGHFPLFLDVPYNFVLIAVDTEKTAISLSL